MVIVIIAGGSGTRLWPLSKPDYPKHLLKVNGDDMSLMQHAYKRAKRLTDKIYVVTEAGHVQHVKDQLPDLPEDSFIVEPGRRGTANCIVAALEHISETHPGDEAVAFMHSDHYIRDVSGFRHSFRLADKVARREKRIVLVSVEPDRPETGFGYIEKGDLVDENELVFNVQSFKEKPDYKTAKTYFKSGNYLWNGGYFVGTPETFLRLMKKYSPELYDNYKRLKAASSENFQETYLSFKSDAIEYALIEKVPDLMVVPATFDWMDLGSFSDLHKAVSGDELGNHTTGNRIALEKVQNSYVHNGEEKPVAIIGLDNVVVVNTPHGVLVTRTDLSQKVGEISKKLTEEDSQA